MKRIILVIILLCTGLMFIDISISAKTKKKDSDTIPQVDLTVYYKINTNDNKFKIKIKVEKDTTFTLFHDKNIEIKEIEIEGDKNDGKKYYCRLNSKSDKIKDKIEKDIVKLQLPNFKDSIVCECSYNKDFTKEKTIKFTIKKSKEPNKSKIKVKVKKEPNGKVEIITQAENGEIVKFNRDDTVSIEPIEKKIDQIVWFKDFLQLSNDKIKVFRPEKYLTLFHFIYTKKNKKKVEIIPKYIVLKKRTGTTNFALITGTETSTFTATSSDNAFSKVKPFVGISGYANLFNDYFTVLGEIRLGGENVQTNQASVLKDAQAINFDIGFKIFIDRPHLYIRFFYEGSYIMAENKDFKNKLFAGLGSMVRDEDSFLNGTYLECGWGCSETFIYKKWRRFKIRGRLNLNMPGDYLIFLDAKFDTDMFTHNADDLRIMIGFQFEITKIIDMIKTPFSTKVEDKK